MVNLKRAAVILPACLALGYLAGLVGPDVLMRVASATVPGFFFGHFLSMGGEIKEIKFTVIAVFVAIALAEP